MGEDLLSGARAILFVAMVAFIASSVRVHGTITLQLQTWDNYTAIHVSNSTTGNDTRCQFVFNDTNPSTAATPPCATLQRAINLFHALVKPSSSAEFIAEIRLDSDQYPTGPLVVNLTDTSLIIGRTVCVNPSPLPGPCTFAPQTNIYCPLPSPANAAAASCLSIAKSNASFTNSSVIMTGIAFNIPSTTSKWLGNAVYISDVDNLNFNHLDFLGVAAPSNISSYNITRNLGSIILLNNIGGFLQGAKNNFKNMIGSLGGSILKFKRCPSIHYTNNTVVNNSIAVSNVTGTIRIGGIIDIMEMEYAAFTSMSFTDNTIISQNYNMVSGGVMSASGGANINMQFWMCTFDHNRIILDDPSHQSVGQGAALYVLGAGALSTILINSTSFTNNYIGGSGLIAAYGGAVVVEGQVKYNISGGTWANNTVDVEPCDGCVANGGALYLPNNATGSSIMNAQFLNNVVHGANAESPAICVVWAHPNITANYFDGNYVYYTTIYPAGASVCNYYANQTAGYFNVAVPPVVDNRTISTSLFSPEFSLNYTSPSNTQLSVSGQFASAFGIQGGNTSESGAQLPTEGNWNVTQLATNYTDIRYFGQLLLPNGSAVMNITTSMQFSANSTLQSVLAPGITAPLPQGAVKYTLLLEGSGRALRDGSSGNLTTSIIYNLQASAEAPFLGGYTRNETELFVTYYWLRTDSTIVRIVVPKIGQIDTSVYNFTHVLQEDRAESSSTDLTVTLTIDLPPFEELLYFDPHTDMGVLLTDSPTTSSHSGSGLEGWQIAIIVVLPMICIVVLTVILAIPLVMFYFRKRQRRATLRSVLAAPQETYHPWA